MKKIILGVSFAIVAIAAGAAEIKWSARNIYIPVATDVSVDQSGIVADSGSKFATGALTVSLFWVGNDSTQHAIGDFATTSDGAIAAQVLGNSSTDTALYDAMLLEGATYKPTYYYTATYTTADGVYTYSGTAAASAAIGNLPSSAISVGANFATTGSWNYTATVPEPTTGFLVLIGIAGLALRRRRA